MAEMHYPLQRTRRPERGTAPGWFSSAAPEHNLQGKHRPPVTQVREMPFRLRQRMLSHWHALSTVEVTVHLLAGPQAQDYFSSPSTFSQQWLAELETVNMGANRKSGSSL